MASNRTHWAERYEEAPKALDLGDGKSRLTPLSPVAPVLPEKSNSPTGLRQSQRQKKEVLSFNVFCSSISLDGPIRQEDMVLTVIW